MLSALKKLDKHPFIAKKQASLAKAFTSWKKGSAIDSAHDLAWYFDALGREQIARSIVDEIADHTVFSNNDRMWGPAAQAIALAARFARKAKDTKRYKGLMARVIEHPPFADGAPRDYFEDTVRRNVDQLVAAADEKPATACLYAANSLTVFVFYAEALRHGGLPFDRWLDAATLENRITEASELLAERILVAK